VRRQIAALAAASAAYAPLPALELSTHGAAAVPGVTATYTQADGETPTRTITSVFPSAFTYNPALDVPGCAPDDEAAATCPEASRIGTLVVTSPLGTADGPVHLMRDLRLVAFLGAYGGLVDMRVVGTTRVRHDGSFQLSFDDLPNLPVRSSVLTLEGGTKGIVVNPRRCATYPVQVTLTSQSDETVRQEIPVTIDGCGAPVVVDRLRVAAGRLLWRVSEAATTRVVLLRRTGAVWRQVRAVRRRGTILPLVRLRAGRYRALLRATTADGRVSRAAVARFRLG
jgi:hypothetical protein